MLPDRSHTLYLEQDTAMTLPSTLFELVISSLGWVLIGQRLEISEIIMTLGRCDEVQTSSIVSILLPKKAIQISTLQYGPKSANGK